VFRPAAAPDNPEHRGYGLCREAEDIGRSWITPKSPQTNGVAERLDRTVLDESAAPPSL
jgi:hypothetical protein